MYPPLKIATQLNISDIPNRNEAKYYLLDAESGNNELLMLLNENSGFGTERYNGKYKEFSDYIHRQWQHMYKWATGYEPDKNVFNRSNRATVLDSFSGMVIISRWNKYKKVYRFDQELELSLATVDEVKIPLNMFKRLPFKSFYLEFAPEGIFTPTFHGCFVEVLDLNNAIGFRLVRLTSDLKIMNGSGTFYIDNTQEEPCVVVTKQDVNGKHEDDPNGLRTDWEEFCFFTLNAMIYLCASNADIRPSKSRTYADVPFQKATKPSEQLDVSDCGFAYGETIRLNRQKETGSSDVSIPLKTPRRSPRPHPVRASWQHYWTGSGENKQKILIFKDPYFTGTKVNVATISRVTE